MKSARPGDTPSTLRTHASALGCLAWVLGLRLLFVVHGGYTAKFPWALTADLALFALVLLSLPSLRTLPRVGATAALVSLAYYAAGQHVRTHGTLFRLAHARVLVEGDFVAGSVLTPDVAYLPLYLLWTTIGLLRLSAPHRRGEVAAGSGSRRAAGALALLAAYFVATPNATHPANNVVVASLTQIPGTIWRIIPRESEPRPMIGRGRREPDFFVTERRPLEPASRPNVLVIVVEALSGAYLPSVARAQGVASELRIPRLDRALERHGFRVYPNMINMQRQTDRGTYPLLCGDYPRIVTSVTKMSTVADLDVPLDCLPALLRRSGYHTLYYQAAHLRFMQKDAFMRLAGFDRVVGREELAERGVEGEGWGPGDEAFYAAATDELLEMTPERSPWFTMLLNVGTHHPYANGTEPQDTFVPPAAERRERAFEIMSESVERLLDALEANDVLENTLVFVVSDESGGVILQDGEPHPLGSNWGMLAVRTPTADGLDELAAADRIAAQIDVPVTVLDLLGVRTPTDMIGRSLTFHGREQPRGLLFGDTYAARTHFLRETGELVACGEMTLRCEHWVFRPERLFGSLQWTDQEPELTLNERLGLVADASIVRHVGAHEGAGIRHAPMALQAGGPRRIELPAEVLDGDHLQIALRLRQFDDAAVGGRFTLEIGESGRGGPIARSTIALAPGAVEPKRLELTAPTRERAPETLDLLLRWAPRDDTSPVALLELSIQPARD